MSDQERRGDGARTDRPAVTEGVLQYIHQTKGRGSIQIVSHFRSDSCGFCSGECGGVPCSHVSGGTSSYFFGSTEIVCHTSVTYAVSQPSLKNGPTRRPI